MIPDNEKWHYLTVKKKFALLRGITSNHVGDVYGINPFHSFSTKSRLKKHVSVCKIMIIVM